MFPFGCGRLIGLLVLLVIAAIVVAVAKLVARQPPAGPAPSRFCAKCGSPLSPGARFCPGCGSAVS
ncbi:MAG: zinc-ribbon domain-containing protein [Bryobacteraceae bacterium]|jgi:hypothetical protein